MFLTYQEKSCATTLTMPTTLTSEVEEIPCVHVDRSFYFTKCGESAMAQEDGGEFISHFLHEEKVIKAPPAGERRTLMNDIFLNRSISWFFVAF